MRQLSKCQCNILWTPFSPWPRGFWAPISWSTIGCCVTDLASSLPQNNSQLFCGLICGLLCSECWKTWKVKAIFSCPEDHCNNKDNDPMELQIFIVLYAFPKHFHIHYCNQLRQQPLGLQLRKEKSWGPCSRSYSQVVRRLGLEARLHDWASISSLSSSIRLSHGHALWLLWPLTHSPYWESISPDT